MSKGFNFGQIGDIISKVMDTDYIDIKRDVQGSLQEIYSNILCHISYNSSDNPDPASIDIKPIIQSITLNLPNWVDIQNNDFIIAKKIDSDGNIIQVYSGRCGNPVVSQARKKVVMTMNGTDNDDPTPVPPEKAIRIEINYLSDNQKIQDTIINEVEIGTELNIPAPTIEGYKAINSSIDGVIQDNTTIYIASVDKEYKIDFIYEKSNEINKYSFLVKGLYTKDDGSLANGYHLYKKIPIISIKKNEDNTYTIESENKQSIHEDNGKVLSIQIGTKLVLLPTNTFVQVQDILGIEHAPNVDKIEFSVKEFTPTEDEKNAYPTRWYD